METVVTAGLLKDQECRRQRRIFLRNKAIRELDIRMLRELKDFKVLPRRKDKMKLLKSYREEIKI